jgi:chloramphenicol-sensitive protein RarD
VVPLLCFGGAATRIPLSTLGLMQYLTPSVQFVLGLVVFREPMPAMRWVGFGLIWLALLLFTVETLRNRQRVRAEAEPVTV